MAGVGVYPKIDGDIYYGLDTNMAYYQANLASTLNHASVNVTNVATLILAANPNRKSVIVMNNGTNTIWIGVLGSVTTSNGFALKSGESMYLYNREAIYGITASTTEDARYLEAQ